MTSKNAIRALYEIFVVNTDLTEPDSRLPGMGAGSQADVCNLPDRKKTPKYTTGERRRTVSYEYSVLFKAKERDSIYL